MRSSRSWGGGGWAEVYRVWDTRLDRPVALKLLPPELSQDPQALARFKREAQAASKLNHLNICTVYDVGEHQGRYFIVMELVQGETLKQLIQGRPLPIDRFLGLSLQITDALQAAHERGIIHRDIKPGNILVTEKGVVKLLDFGLAKQIEGSQSDYTLPYGSTGEESLTRTGTTAGTAAYMSPEQARGEKVDARSDVFSLGVVLYEMATGKPPFEGRTLATLFDAILRRTPTPPARWNPGLPPRLEEIIHKALEKDRELRYQHTSDLRADLQRLKRDLQSGEAAAAAESGAGKQTSQPSGPAGSPAALADSGTVRPAGRLWKFAVPVALVTLAVVGGVLYSRRSPALTEKDFIVLGDFENTTGDAVFDSALRKALAIQLQQSPYLNLVPEERIQEALRRMGRTPEEKLNKAVAREVCLREGVKAMLNGSIASLGSQYVIALEAVNCQSGETLASEQVEVAGKEAVLGTLGKTASAMRHRLGESLSSIRKLDAPLERATTPSLEALKAFSLGDALRNKSDLEAVPFYQRAIELDPNFALAYARLGTIYGNLREGKLSREYRTKAFELRERVSEVEKFYIMEHYYDGVTREQDKAIETSELWRQIYPRASVPRNNLAVDYNARGEYEKALQAAQEGVQITPDDVFLQTLWSLCQGSLGNLKEYREIAERAALRWPDSFFFRRQLHAAAFLEGDAAGMQRHLAWAQGRPGAEVQFLYPARSATEAYGGRLRQARESTRLGVEAAQRRKLSEVAAGFLVRQALAEALFGNRREARELLRRLSPDELSEDALPALALALAGDAGAAEALAEKAQQRWPLWPFLNEVGLPEARAAIALERGDPARAVEVLQPARRWERAVIWSNYLRGLALLRLGKGAEAAVEFQATIDKKYPGAIIDRRHFRTYDSVRAVAVLWLARAYALSGESDKARAAYQDFFTLWKDADPDIPILREARAESAKLR